MIVAIVGEGQLAKCLAHEFPGEAAMVEHSRLDIVTGRGFEILEDLDPDVIVNTAAFHDVQGCEDNIDKAISVNYHGVRNLCNKANELGVKFIHIGTDYAYTGSGKPIPETAPMRPVNTYGATKAYGMRYVLQQGQTVVNIAALWSRWPSRAKKTNFMLTMRDKAQKGKKARVVDNLITSFTYGPHAAKAIRFLLDKPPGLYNVVNADFASWFEFARAIYAWSGGDPDMVVPIQYHGTPRRPAFSALSVEKLEAMGHPMPTWSESLAEFFKREWDE